eukprot:TRINITY_DN109451_c0_g1_i1.p1 TRINITY_DN109451_c0_g1~~TRINITY_DN109451_c0_g1_i1.p1  ORF type:complete len:379 (-),score=48.70 TRINITY_DN109451_c0_g1_i1:88-1224(-)
MNRSHFKDFKDGKSPIPRRGIVTASGGPRLPLTWASIALLRSFGSKLPIELFHLKGEMTAASARLFLKLGVRPRALQAPQAKGYWTLPHVIAESDFDEILFLAGDGTPLTNLDMLFSLPAYKHYELLLTTDLMDVSQRDWFPDAWLRLGLRPPECPKGVRCRKFWETDSAIMVIDKGRCPGVAALRALAADGQETGRYGIAGDKELYRLAWEMSGCNVSSLPYPSISGVFADGIFMGFGLMHRTWQGKPLILHWAWGKYFLSDWEYFPNLNVVREAPIDGYAEIVKPIQAVPQLDKCYSGEGDEVPCSSLVRPMPRIQQLERLFYVAKKAFHEFEDCRKRGIEQWDCPLRQKIPWLIQQEVDASILQANVLNGKAVET